LLSPNFSFSGVHFCPCVGWAESHEAHQPCRTVVCLVALDPPYIVVFGSLVAAMTSIEPGIFPGLFLEFLNPFHYVFLIDLSLSTNRGEIR
jgi:hypothetical protein